MFLPDFGRKFFAKSAEVATMAPVEFLILFPAGHSHTGGVNDDDMVSGIKKRCVSRTMFALQESGCNRRNATQYLGVRVDDVPMARDVLLAWDVGWHRRSSD